MMSGRRKSERRTSGGEAPDPSQTTSDRVIQLLNDASLSRSDSDKVRKLQQVQELIVNKEQALLDNFTDEVLAFQADRSQEVRKFVIGFMEEASKKDNELLTKVIANLNLLISDATAGVIKKLVQSMTQLFGIIVEWLSRTKTVNDSHKACWKVTCGIKDHILGLYESHNDGIRTMCVKFAEKVVLTLSELQQNSDITPKAAAAFSLNKVPAKHTLLEYDNLKADGEKALNGLLTFISNPAITSVNLMAAMGSLSAIARQRPQFMGTVVQAFETLHANLPPTLAKTQVASVRKQLKMQLMNMLKLFSSTRYHPQITNLLYDLGTTSSEIAKNMPKVSQQPATTSRKRNLDKKSGQTDAKKSKKDLDEYDEDDIETPATSSVPDAAPVVNQQSVAIDITAEELAPLLTPENVANLVLLSMVMLPDKMPDAFQASYTPIESAGTDDQIKHLARLLSIQMTAMKIGPGIQKASELAAQEREKKKKQEAEVQAKDTKLKIQTVIGGTTKPVVNEDAVRDKKAKENIEAMISSQTVVPRHGIHRRIQGFKLEAITTPLSLEVKDKIVRQAVQRVLKSEANAYIGGVHKQWQKILPSLVAQFGGDLHRTLAEFILEDVRNRAGLAFAWLYEEYNIYLENFRGSIDKSALENYDACLTGLLQGFREKPDVRDELFNRLAMQAPLLTEGAIKQIGLYCESEKRSESGIQLVTKLMVARTPKRMQFLKILLTLCSSAVESIQSLAITSAESFYHNGNYQEYIHAYAVAHLNFLTKESPPPNLLNASDGEVVKEAKWNDALIKQCLGLGLALLPLNHSLIMDLADVYVKSSGDIKRVVLRVLDAPVTRMGMDSPQLLLLVEECPKGAETLVTRMLHILTDKTLPSAELVQRVRDLYIKRVPDVRFLIPVLNGLEKHEVLKALPKLVQLSPPVVKGVFNRLLGVNRTHDADFFNNALTPVELLVALHKIDASVVDVKSVIKATGFCFAQKAVYTSEVLVTVINQLVDEDPIPTLLMRTVIQSVITYPRLSGFIMNVLHRLILKKVWEQGKVWEGFIKCCQRLKPQSFQVLLQLPPPQFKSVLESTPDLRDPIKQYVDKFTPQQKLHVNKGIIVLLEQDPSQVHVDAHKVKMETSLPFTEHQKIYEEQLQKAVLEQTNILEQNANLEGRSSATPPPPGESDQSQITSPLSKSPHVKLVMTSAATQGQKRRSPTPTLDETPEPKSRRIDS